MFVFKVAELFAENLLLFEAGEKLKFEVDVEQGYWLLKIIQSSILLNMNFFEIDVERAKSVAIMRENIKNQWYVPEVEDKLLIRLSNTCKVIKYYQLASELTT